MLGINILWKGMLPHYKLIIRINCTCYIIPLSDLDPPPANWQRQR